MYRCALMVVLLAFTSAAPASAQVCSTLSPNLSNGLVRYYPLDGNTNDLSINAVNATAIGATPTADRFGTPDGAYAFSGQNQYILSTANGLPAGTRTVALWFLSNSVANFPVMMGYGGNGCNSAWFMGLNVNTDHNTYYVHTHCVSPILIAISCA